MEITEKQKEIVKDWVRVLRSGKYKQTKHKLCDEGKYCCLGVLAEHHLGKDFDLEGTINDEIAFQEKDKPVYISSGSESLFNLFECASEIEEGLDKIFELNFIPQKIQVFLGYLNDGYTNNHSTYSKLREEVLKNIKKSNLSEKVQDKIEDYFDKHFSSEKGMNFNQIADMIEIIFQLKT